MRRELLPLFPRLELRQGFFKEWQLPWAGQGMILGEMQHELFCCNSYIFNIKIQPVHQMRGFTDIVSDETTIAGYVRAEEKPGD